MYSGEEIREIRKAKETWENAVVASELRKTGERKSAFLSASGIPIKRAYTPLDLVESGWDYIRDVGFPGQYPFADSVNALGYRGSLWDMYQYGGHGTAEDTNKRLKHSFAQGAKELGLALDLPTQLGYDSDHLMAEGEVGRIGVAIDSLADIETVYDGLPLEAMVPSTTANAIGPIYFAMIVAAAENRGLSPAAVKKLRFIVQNDVLKEYVARGTHIFPPKYGLKFSGDLIEYVIRNKFESVIPIIYCGYHISEAGANAFQEVGFILADAAAYIGEVVRRGISADNLPEPRCNSCMSIDFFECIAKHRALRRMWAKMMKEQFGATNPRVMSPTLFSGVEAAAYTAQQPLNNLIRGAIGTLAAVLSGVTSCNTACFDEAHSIPTYESQTLAMRTQQIVAYETGVTNTADPLAGSYYVETLTSQIEEKAWEEFEKVQAVGGSVAAIENGYMKQQIRQSAYEKQRKVETGEKVVVGVNKYQTDEPVSYKIFRVNPAEEARQVEKLNKLRRERNNDKVKRALQALSQAADEGVNLVPTVMDAVKAYATIGEMCGVLRSKWGEYAEYAGQKR